MTTDTAPSLDKGIPVPNEAKKAGFAELRGQYKALRPFVRRATFGLEGTPQIRVARKAAFTAARAVKEDLEQRYRKDPLSNLFTKAAMTEIIQIEAERAQQDGEPMQLIFVDLNGFKGVNDNLGHDVGDAAIREFGALLSANIRPYDIAGKETEEDDAKDKVEKPTQLTQDIDADPGEFAAARFGGDEFIILLKKSNMLGVESVFRRLKKALKSNEFFQGLDAQGQPVSMAVGAVTVDTQDPLESLRRADLAMYQAKEIHRQNGKIGSELVMIQEADQNLQFVNTENGTIVDQVSLKQPDAK